MHTPEHLDRSQLLELAVLDAFGLLEEVESEFFDRSFHHAPEAVQQEIRDLQAALVSDDRLLPSEKPVRELRQRVLDAVSDAIEQDGERFAPLAAIGRHRERRPQRVRAILSPSGQFWRAASFVLLGTVIVVSYFFADALRTNADISKAAMNSDTAELARIIGPNFKEFLFDPAVRSIHLTDGNDASDPRAVIYYIENGDQSQAFLVCSGLNRNGDTPYRIEFHDENGRLAHSGQFISNGRVSGANLSAIPIAMLSACTISILDAGGEVLLRTA